MGGVGAWGFRMTPRFRQPNLCTDPRATCRTLTDERWAHIAPLLPEQQPPGPPRLHYRRLIVEAILDVLDNGVA